jgi:hypothetical protein
LNGEFPAVNLLRSVSMLLKVDLQYCNKSLDLSASSHLSKFSVLTSADRTNSRWKGLGLLSASSR